MTPAAAGFVAPSTKAIPDEALASDLAGEPAGGPVTLLLPLVVGSFAAFVLLRISRRRLAATRSGARPGSGPEPGEESPSDPFVPRWLRPSVAAARVGIGPTTVIDPEAPAEARPARARRVFTGGIDRGVERVLIRYDRVPLLDVPDDALGRTKAELDADDEVEVIERDGIWAQVRTPTGAVGWVPTMTITRGAAGTDDEASANAAAQTHPPHEAAPVGQEPPPLEALIEAIVAQRLARQELAIGPDGPTIADEAPSAPKRTRARKPRSDRPDRRS